MALPDRPMLAPILQSFQHTYPEVVVRYLTGDRLFRLEYGEAHVAVRAGNIPDQPDNVVQPFFRQRMGLYAAKNYADQHGLPKNEEDFAGHWFIAHDNIDNRAPFFVWLRQHIDEDAIRFRSTDTWSMEAALRAGAGIGFMPVLEARKDPNLIEIIPSRDEWSAALWLVTHVDLHRTTKVQAFLTHLKNEAQSWDV